MLALSIDSTINQKVWEFLLDGGAFMFFIVACSLVSAAIVIHRLLSLRREGVMPRSLVTMLENAQPGSVDPAAIRVAAARSDSPLGDIVEASLAESCDDAAEASRSAEAVAREEVLRLQTGLSVLEDVITIAPLLGLLGTVSGLVGVFAELGTAEGDSADPTVLASGIARALNTTIGGLAVAVPTVMARSFFTKKIETMAARMEVLVGRLIHSVHRRDNEPSPVSTPGTAVETAVAAPPASSVRATATGLVSEPVAAAVQAAPGVAGPPPQSAASPAELPSVMQSPPPSPTPPPATPQPIPPSAASPAQTITPPPPSPTSLPSLEALAPSDPSGAELHPEDPAS